MRGPAAAIAVIVLLGVSLGAADARRPALRIVDLAPLTVQGTSFKAGERVKLLVNAGGPHAKTVRAGRRGGFTVRLDVSVRGCTAVVVQAIGGRGSRAMVDLTRPGCDERPER
jgi:hypothetical protein